MKKIILGLLILITLVIFITIKITTEVIILKEGDHDLGYQVEYSTLSFPEGEESSCLVFAKRLAKNLVNKNPPLTYPFQRTSPISFRVALHGCLLEYDIEDKIISLSRTRTDP